MDGIENLHKYISTKEHTRKEKAWTINKE